MKLLFLLFSLFCLCSCQSPFLDVKPTKDIDLLEDLDDLENLLENSYVFGNTGSLKIAACDDYYLLSRNEWDALPTMTEKNVYVWNKDTYGGETNISDWNEQYKAIFYANAILDKLSDLEVSPVLSKARHIKGEALFHRAYAYFDLAIGFCSSFDVNGLNDGPGLPLRTSANIDRIEPTSSLKATYKFIEDDLIQSSHLLKGKPFPVNHRNRPSLEASFAMLARVYLAMGKYERALLYADSCLQLYDTLLDYNHICKDCLNPFQENLDEVIFSSTNALSHANLTSVGERLWMAIDTTLIQSYKPNDLRLKTYYVKNRNGNYNKKRGYIKSGSYDFSGLATDEIYLIRAECYARNGQYELAKNDLNTLLLYRFESGSHYKIEDYPQNELLELILNERRKSLVWRGLRWSDLKRLGLEGRYTLLKRKLDNEYFELDLNQTSYVFPMPDNEITLSKTN